MTITVMACDLKCATWFTLKFVVKHLNLAALHGLLRVKLKAFVFVINKCIDGDTFFFSQDSLFLKHPAALVEWATGIYSTGARQ